MSSDPLNVYLGPALAEYHFGPDHPFGPRRHGAFADAFKERGLAERCEVQAPVSAGEGTIGRFHTEAYIERVQRLSREGAGFLDYGDTPAVKGIYEAAASVVGTTVDATTRIMQGECRRAFSPIAGLHHAAREHAAGFCVFNDCGVAIETLLERYDLSRVAYVDIDAHHGDGVFYAFESNMAVLFADLHQDGRTLYPGTGHANETGKGRAQGSKLNIPMPPGADDRQFMSAWEKVERFLLEHQPQFILLQCGVDSMAGDPITGLQYTAAAHAHAARRLREIAETCCDGRLLAMGGGGYNLGNIADGWTAVVEAMV